TALLPWAETMHNSHWINYLWYNQLRFINYTVAALDLIKGQLHATTIMAVQNRFILNSIMAPHDGVCKLIGDECYTIIPLHTGDQGTLNYVLDQMTKLKE
ncbi:hypothetical protein C0J45_1012, partial [Silurus meridionalis]